MCMLACCVDFGRPLSSDDIGGGVPTLGTPNSSCSCTLELATHCISILSPFLIMPSLYALLFTLDVLFTCVTNVGRTYGLQSAQRHKDDTTSVCSWVKEMKDNAVIIYENFDNLSEKDCQWCTNPSTTNNNDITNK